MCQKIKNGQNCIFVVDIKFPNQGINKYFEVELQENLF